MTENEAMARLALAVSFALEQYAAHRRKIDEPIPYRPTEPAVHDTEPPHAPIDPVAHWKDLTDMIDTLDKLDEKVQQLKARRAAADTAKEETLGAPATSIADGVSVDPGVADAFDELLDKSEDHDLPSRIERCCAESYKPLSCTEIAGRLIVGAKYVSAALKAMVRDGVLLSEGGGRGKRYRVKRVSEVKAEAVAAE